MNTAVSLEKHQYCTMPKL